MYPDLKRDAFSQLLKVLKIRPFGTEEIEYHEESVRRLKTLSNLR
jgi:hypothetical protein